MAQIEIIDVDAEGNEIGRRMVDLPPEPPFNPVPAEIQMWQARAILFRSGLLGMVEEAVKAAANPEIEIAWEYAPNAVRRSIFVTSMAVALSLTDEQLDHLFIEGAKIK